MIGWWSHVQDVRVASTRIRGELVMRGLRARGVAAEWFSPGDSQRYKTLVLGKRYDEETLDLTEKLQTMGVRVVLDLCDNRFVSRQQDSDLASSQARLKRAVRMADHVVASSPTLAEAIRNNCPDVRAVSVIGDLADDLSVIPIGLRDKLWAAWRASRSLRRLQELKNAGHLGLVWFGSHGGPYSDAGMPDLLKIRDDLERLHPKSRIFLSVVSNSLEKFSKITDGWAIPTLYFEWNPANFQKLLCAHEIALIPITESPFALCKTDNRVVTALNAGLAVAADVIPAYEPYRRALGLADWPSMLSRLAESEAERTRTVSAGLEIAAKLTSPEMLIGQWCKVLQ